MKKLEGKILDTVNTHINNYGLEVTLDKMYSALNESKLRKERLLETNSSIGNTDSHIEMCSDIIDYLIEKNIQNILAVSE
jgi:hypothetical protein